MKTTNYRIEYLRRGEKTIATNKEGNQISFESIGEARRFVNKARANEPNNPITFMNKVNICEFENDKFVSVVEQF
jgi:hypothetical protein